MAFYKQDIVDINLNTGNIFRSFLPHSIGYKDDDADRFGIRAFRDGEPVDLSGVSCQAIFMNPNGTNIALTSYGTVSGNVAYVTLPPACYDYEGQFCLAIKIVGGGVTGTVRIVDGTVTRTGASGAVAPTSSVPTYQEIISVYDDMVDATAAANLAIAETFDATKAYPADKYVINEGHLYRLTADHAANVTWANTSKVATNFGDELTSTKSAFVQDEKYINGIATLNLFDYSQKQSGGYYGSNGTITSNEGSEYSEQYIKIDSNVPYMWYSPEIGAGTGASMQICTYDAEKSFIRRINSTPSGSGYTFENSEYYVRVSMYSGSLNQFVFSNSNGFDSGIGNKRSELKLESVAEKTTTFFTYSKNVMNPEEYEEDAFISSTGTYTTSDGSMRSGKIYVSAGDVIRFTKQSALYLAVYKTNNTFVERVDVSALDSYTITYDGYVIFARYQIYFVDKFMVTINSTFDEYIPYGIYVFDYEKDIEEKTIKKIEEAQGKQIATKTATSLEVIVKNLKFVINKYNDATIRAVNLWRTNNCYIDTKENGFNRLWYNSDSDGVVRIHGEDDFIGGYHGDETQTLFKLFVDGVEYAENSAFSNKEFREIVLYCESDVYHCNTSSSSSNVAFKRKKTIIFNKDGYTVENYWIAQETLLIDRAYMGMLSVERYTDSNYTDYMLNGYSTDHDYAYVNADKGSGATADRKEVVFHTIYGDIGIKISDIVTPGTYYGDVTNYNSSYDKRLKAYLANINSNNGVSISSGAVIKAKAVTFSA